jgi:hypothetical protein
MNCLRTLLNRLADAASYWLQTPFDAADELWLHQPPRDGADRLAEREAEEEVLEPVSFKIHSGEGLAHVQVVVDGVVADGPTGTIRDGLICHVPNQDDLEAGYRKLAADPDMFRSGGQTKEYGPRPRLSTPGPRLSDFDRLDKRLDNIIGLLEGVRDLLQHNGGQGDGKDVGQRAESSSGAVPTPTCPTSPPTTSAAPDIRSSVDAADGPRGTAAQPETRAGHPNPQ